MFFPKMFGNIDVNVSYVGWKDVNFLKDYDLNFSWRGFYCNVDAEMKTNCW